MILYAYFYVCDNVLFICKILQGVHFWQALIQLLKFDNILQNKQPTNKKNKATKKNLIEIVLINAPPPPSGTLHPANSKD